MRCWASAGSCCERMTCEREEDGMVLLDLGGKPLPRSLNIYNIIAYFYN